MSSIPSPAPTPTPAPKRTPDYAMLIAIELIAEYEKKRGAVKCIGLKLPKLSLAARMVFVAIASRAWYRQEDKRYRSRPGIHGYLHFITGANPERTIPKAIKELEAAGLLKVTRRFNEQTRRRESHLYEIIESPEAYQAVVERNAEKPKPKRVRGGSFPAAVEEVDAARQLQADYAAIYADKRSGTIYIPISKDAEAALAIVRAYPDAEYRKQLMEYWATPDGFDKIPPAHDVRQIAYAPIYLPRLDKFWREKGYGPGWEKPQSEP